MPAAREGERAKTEDSEGELWQPRASRRLPTRSTLHLGANTEEAAVKGRLEAHRQPREKDAEACAVIHMGLRQSRICEGLSDEDARPILEAMEYFVFGSGDAVEKEGEASGLFFVVHEGSLEVRSSGNAVQPLGRGGTFGVDALLWGSSVSDTVAVPNGGFAGIWATSGVTVQRLLRERAQALAAENRRFLFSLPLLDCLPSRQIDLLSHAFNHEVAEAGATVIAKGEPTKAMYFVKAGSLSVADGEPANGAVRRAQEPRRLGPGDCFGERALLFSDQRSATIVADQRCELLKIGAEHLRSALGTDLRAYLERCLILSGLRDSLAVAQFSALQRSAIVNAFQLQELPPEASVAEAFGDGFHAAIVVEGDLRHRSGVKAPISRGRRIGGNSWELEQPDPRALAKEPWRDLTAGPSGARLAVLSRHDLVQALLPQRRRLTSGGVQFSDAAESEYAQKLLLVKKVPVLRHLSQEQTERVVNSLQIQRFHKGEIAIHQGDLGESLFVIAKGEVTVKIDGELIRTQGRNACFGERALLFDEKRTATVQVSSNNAELWRIDKATFAQIVHGNMRQELMHRIELQDTQVSLEDLRHVQLIGTGAFSSVQLVEHRRTGVRYALKVVRKQNGQIPPEMRNEVAVLLENDHPFILRVVKTFQTTSRVAMLTELVTGGDLHAAIRTIPMVLSRSQAQFYIGSLVITIEALWDRGVVYRDLKPENVMLDAQGYLKLIDFGISKKLADTQTRTFTMVGTPHYMAPEVMRGRGYSAAVDLWSLGVMLFEFVCGYLPFADDLNEPTKVCTAVLKEPLTFPRGYHDIDGRQLIKALICRPVEKRLGTGAGGLAKLKASRFFCPQGEESPDVLFERIMGRELEPPLVPQSEEYHYDPCDPQASSLSDVEELWPKRRGRLSRQTSPASSASGRHSDHKPCINGNGSAREPHWAARLARLCCCGGL